MQLVYDTRGRLPRFVVHSNVVVNQYTGDSVAYSKDWMPAYIKLYVKYKKDGL